MALDIDVPKDPDDLTPGILFKPLGQFTNTVATTQTGTGTAGDTLFDVLKADYDANTTSGAGFVVKFDAFLAERGTDAAFPGGMESFLREWRTFAEFGEIDNSTTPPTKILRVPAFDFDTDPVVQEYFRVFKLQLDPTLSGGTAEDWEAFTAAEKEELFKGLLLSNFAAYLRSDELAAAQAGGGRLSRAEFFSGWAAFILQVSTVSDSYFNLAGGAAAMRGLLPSYEKIFKGLFDGRGQGVNGADLTVAEIDAEFKDQFKRFAQGVHEGGTFNPAIHIDEWAEQIIEVSRVQKMPSLSTDEQERRVILNLIFEILQKVLQVTEATVSVQAERLRYLTKYQVEYTELLGRIPFYQTNATLLMGAKSEWADPNNGVGELVALMDPDFISGQLGITVDDELANWTLGFESVIGDGETFQGETINFLNSPGFAGMTLAGLRSAINNGNNSLRPPKAINIWDHSPSRTNIGTDKSFRGTNGKPGGTFGVVTNENDGDWPGVWWFAEQPYGTAGDAKWGTEDLAERQKLIGEINNIRTQWQEGVRSRRNIVKDDAKQAQSTLSQTKEAINQQTNFISSILQLLSGLLQTIFR